MRKRLLSLLCVTSLLLTLLPTSVFAADAITGTQPTVTSEPKPGYTAPKAVENLVYNGQNQMLITAGTAPEGCTMQYKLDDGEYSPDLPTAKDAGTYTVYYKAVGNGTNGDSEEKSVKVTITQADYKGTKETTGYAKFGTEGTVDLSALIVEGGKLGEVKVEDTSSVLDGELSMDGKTLKFKFKTAAKKDQNAKVTVQVTSDNYKEYTITVNLKVTEKLAQAPLKYAGRKTVTYGDTLQLNVTGGSGEGAVTYTASFNGKLPTAVENGLLTTTTGTGVFLVRVDKAGDDTHEGTFVTFTITVIKAPLKIEVANKQIYVGEAAPDLAKPQI